MLGNELRDTVEKVLAVLDRTSVSFVFSLSMTTHTSGFKTDLFKSKQWRKSSVAGTGISKVWG